MKTVSLRYSLPERFFTIAIAAAGTSIGLGDNVKCLAPERSPVSYQDPTSATAQPIPVEIISRSRANRMSAQPWSSTQVTGLYGHVFIEQNGPGGEWTLWLPIQFPAAGAVTFTIQAFYYPDELSQGSDHNALTDHADLGEALINLAKARAYFAEESDSPKGTAALALYEADYRQASYNDVAQQMAGRTLRM